MLLVVWIASRAIINMHIACFLYSNEAIVGNSGQGVSAEYKSSVKTFVPGNLIISFELINVNGLSALSI